jgi:hypothetical protein
MGTTGSPHIPDYWAQLRLCFAKILCALKIARFPAATGCPIQVIPSPRERQESLPKERPHCILVYIKDGGTRTFSRRCVGSD